LNKRFASVVIPRPDISQLIYEVPENATYEKGDAVEIELRKKKTWGIISSFPEDLPEGLDSSSIKPLLGKILSTPLYRNISETKFIKWLADYYIYPEPLLVKQLFTPLISSGNTLTGSSDEMKHLSALQSGKDSTKDTLTLNPEQEAVIRSVTARWEKGDIKPVLLYGLTGSGKSEIFAALAKEVLKSGKQVLYLVPEIGLTTGALNRLINRIGSPGVVIHSFMTKKKRFSAMYCAMKKKAGLIVGTRSSIIYPFFDTGLIIVDEEHDTSYKNLEPPYYNARDAAVMRGSIQKVPVLLGSATPSTDSWYNCINGKYHLETIETRANMKPLPEIRRFPFKGEMYLPADLVERISESVKKGEQSLFFLNRRGFATFAICRECREPAKCPNCNVAMVYHRKKDKIICHHCNYSISTFKCTSCGNSSCEFEGMGIEKLVEALSSYFPGTQIVSFDKDNINTIAMLDRTVKNITEKHYDIIAGTVMISKGHNFPGLANVIIKYADYLLCFKDFRAAEKCFQIITQVAGRAGRFDVDGNVWAEAIYPDHYIWKYLENNDYRGFATEELAWRERLGLPPFTKMTVIKLSGRSEQSVNSASESIYGFLTRELDRFKNIPFIILPPLEPPLSRINNRFRKNITLISPKNSSASKALTLILNSCPVKKGIAVTFDIDPVNE